MQNSANNCPKFLQLKLFRVDSDMAGAQLGPNLTTYFSQHFTSRYFSIKKISSSQKGLKSKGIIFVCSDRSSLRHGWTEGQTTTREDRATQLVICETLSLATLSKRVTGVACKATSVVKRFCRYETSIFIIIGGVKS